MTPLKTLHLLVSALARRPFNFLKEDEKTALLIRYRLAITKLKFSLEKKSLVKTKAYGVVAKLWEDIKGEKFDDLAFIRDLPVLLELYSLVGIDDDLRRFITDLNKTASVVKKKLFEHHALLASITERGKKLTEEQKNIKDLEILQKIGVFYILEYALQVLWEFQTAIAEDKKKLLEIGLKTKAGNLPAYLPLEETFRKELSYKIFDDGLRDKLLLAFYNWEDVLYNSNYDYQKIIFGLKKFNLDLLNNFSKKGLEVFKAQVYFPWGNNISVNELIKKIELL